MDNLYELSLEFTRWLQETYPKLEFFFVAISAAGTEEFYLIFLSLIYWSIDKKLGKLLGYVLFISVVLNTMLKHGFRFPRPFWIDPAVGLEETDGYGIPSGHTQFASAVYLLIAWALGGFWPWLIAILLIIIMALSRIYLGAHFFQDVIAGFIIGVLAFIAAIFWQKRLARRFSNRILGQRMLVAMSVVLAVAALYVFELYLIGQPDLSVPWATFIPAAEITSISNMSKAIGLLAGYSIGILLESSRVRFRADGSLTKRAGRYLIGIVITLLIWYGLGALFPRDPLALAIPLYIIRYFLLALWVAYYAPWFFVRLGLADSDPQAQTTLQL